MKTRVGFLLLLLAGIAFSQQPDRAPLPLRSAVEDKNFYVLSLLERSDQVQALLKTNVELRKLYDAKVADLKAAAECKPDVMCYTQRLMWTTAEIDAVERTLRDLQRESKAFCDAVSIALRTSGAYQCHQELSN